MKHHIFFGTKVPQCKSRIRLGTTTYNAIQFSSFHQRTVLSKSYILTFMTGKKLLSHYDFVWYNDLRPPIHPSNAQVRIGKHAIYETSTQSSHVLSWNGFRMMRNIKSYQFPKQINGGLTWIATSTCIQLKDKKIIQELHSRKQTMTNTMQLNR